MLRAKLMLIIVAALIPLALGIFWYVNHLQTQLDISRANEAKLQQAVATNEETIKVLQRDFKLATEELQKVNDEFAAIRKQNQNLIGKLERHDLGLLGEAKPVLVERIINRATVKANRCIEILSGDDLTEDELAAESGNSFNSECPWLWQPPVSEEEEKVND
jgi:hypothetical protein